jgi:hypothetical protein
MCASADQTSLFADLSGFIALTEAHGDEPVAPTFGGHDVPALTIGRCERPGLIGQG